MESPHALSKKYCDPLLAIAVETGIYACIFSWARTGSPHATFPTRGMFTVEIDVLFRIAFSASLRLFPDFLKSPTRTNRSITKTADRGDFPPVTALISFKVGLLPS